jgi:predicted Zn-dependent peptidase
MLQPDLTTLKSGLRILRIPMPSVKSATVLALVNTGSRYEEANQFGIAHFFEHMVFKGTEQYPTAQDLAMAVDSIGANFNAFTSKEYTGYYVHAAAEQIDLALNVVSDMLLTPKLRQEDIDREKGVIIEEINMYVDSPTSHINNKFDQMVYAGSGLEHDILGLKETVSSMTSDDFVSFLSQWYGFDNIVLVVAGDDHVVGSPSMVEKIELAFSKEAVGDRAVGADPKKTLDFKNTPLSKNTMHIENRKTEQSHFVLGWPALKRGDDRKYTLGMLNTILGGNMSSRLFSEVREQRGLCYYVHSSVDQFHDGGLFGAAAGVDPKRVDEAIEVTIDQFNQVAAGKRPITAKELEMAKQYVGGKVVLGLEDSQSVAQFFGMRLLLQNKLDTPDVILDHYQHITVDEVNQLASEIIKPDEIKFGIIGQYTDEADGERFANLANGKPREVPNENGKKE